MFLVIGSSIIFGGGHYGNVSNASSYIRNRYYMFALPFITAFGAYAGYLTQKNVSLKEAVAIHTWYDFFVFLDVLVSASIGSGNPTGTFALEIPF